jgi:hypothetical protein
MAHMIDPVGPTGDGRDHPSDMRLRARLATPLRLGSLTLPPPTLVLLAAIGGALLTVVAVSRWAVPSDELAYWLAAKRLVAGVPLYDLSLAVGAPYAYWYPPPLAQVLAPFTLVVPDMLFVVAWTGLLLACLYLLGDRKILVALALVAYVPVAVELWYRNVHLVLAVLIVLALRRNALFWIPAAAIKITPVLGLVYLLARGRIREALVVGAVGMGVLAVSVLISPSAWAQFLELVGVQGTVSGASLVPIPFPVRLAAATILAVIAGRLGGRRGEVLLVVALVIGNPTLWMTAFSMLVAIVPLWTLSGRWPRVSGGPTNAGSA